jgi:hypothetical protein
MHLSLDSLLRAIWLSTPLIAGLLLICALFLDNRWRVIGTGIAGAVIFAIVAFAIFGRKLSSEEGWGWVAIGAAVLIGIYTCAGFVFGIGAIAATSKRYRWSSSLLLLFGLLSPLSVPIHEKTVRLQKEREWEEKQEAIRRAPHALLNDSSLADDEDSGYRVRFVDDLGAVRAHGNRADSSVVIPAGKHELVLHGDTPKAQRLKLKWFLQQEVEVEAGCFYKLSVGNGKISLHKLSQTNEPNPTSAPTDGSGPGSR